MSGSLTTELDWMICAIGAELIQFSASWLSQSKTCEWSPYHLSIDLSINMPQIHHCLPLSAFCTFLNLHRPCSLSFSLFPYNIQNNTKFTQSLLCPILSSLHLFNLLSVDHVKCIISCFAKQNKTKQNKTKQNKTKQNKNKTHNKEA